MINYSRTFFPYYKKFCIDKFGVDSGTTILHKSELKLAELISENDDRNNKYIKMHLHKNMLPVIAMYLVLKEDDLKTEDALQYVDEMMHIYRLKMQKKNRIVAKFPFAYGFFRFCCKRVVSKQYPAAGWNIEWITLDANEVHFNMKSCIYVDITSKYKCPELCSLFCANDDVVLAGYKPSIIFKREKTIARGQEKCDFHFYNRSDNR